MTQMYLPIALLSSIVVLIIRRAISKNWERRADDAIGELHSCLPPPRLQNRRPLGVDHLEQTFRANGESCLMELFLLHFRQTGSTLEQVFLGTKAFGTIKLANLEALLSTNFKAFGMGPRRDITFLMFRDSIFTQEGDAWKYLRGVIQPQLTHKQYENLEVFILAVEDLIDTIQNHSGIVDQQPLFFCMTLDVTTAFLFGESVRSLKAPEFASELAYANFQGHLN